MSIEYLTELKIKRQHSGTNFCIIIIIIITYNQQAAVIIINSINKFNKSIKKRTTSPCRVTIIKLRLHKTTAILPLLKLKVTQIINH